MKRISVARTRQLGITIAGALMLGAAAQGAGDAWMTDYDAALKKAKEEHKHLLVDFSGSDWCGWCVRLDEQVFGHEEFQAAAAKDFVLVLLDFPRKAENKAKISEAARARNDELQKQFNVRGFPTVLLLDSNGERYATTGYQPGGVEGYLKHLGELRAGKAVRDTVKAKLDGSQGVARAKLLDELIEATQEREHAELLDEMKEIVALDGDDAAGLKTKYAYKSRFLDATQAQRAGEFEKAETMYAALIADLKPEGEPLQELYLQWGEIKYRQDDKPGIIELLNKAVAAAPESELVPRIESMIKRFSPKPEEAPAPPPTQE